MADPITLAVVGATAGAALNPNDPLKGALIGGTVGFTGGTALGGLGAAGSTAAGTTVGAGGIGGAAGGTGLTATTLGGGVPAGAGLGIGSGGITGLTASTTPAALGMGSGTGLLGTAGTGAMAASPFAAAAATPSLLSTPFQLGGTPTQQAMVANQILARNQQAQQRLPAAPVVQNRPYTGMRQPVNAQVEEERRRLMYALPPMPQIRLI